ncbi:hypothetical protein [Streptomyces sp. VN1]|uniref:hypothetical protein n=1 Tax=Streptomyces sp. VN1 TaxID=1821625 RepID=UPI001414D3F9|nr:hypothetical protein [Streptomyces sp. VN1]
MSAVSVTTTLGRSCRKIGHADWRRSGPSREIGAGDNKPVNGEMVTSSALTR